MVALLSSSGVKLASVNLVRRELFPTLLLPMSSNLRFGGASGTIEVIGSGSRWVGVVAKQRVSHLIRHSQICRPYVLRVKRFMS